MREAHREIFDFLKDAGAEDLRLEAGGKHRRVVSTFRGRDTAALNRGVVQRTGGLKDYPRQALHVWNLVARLLRRMGYG